MTGTIALVALTVLFLAYANGANDIFKGVATLFGSGTATYRKALLWATVTTLAGSLLALYLADGLVESFKGKGLVHETIAKQAAFLTAVGIGGALTVLLATLVGLPVSTTHALTGGLVGAGLVATEGEVAFGALGKAFVLPLLFSPIVALLLTVMLYPIFGWFRRRSGITSQSCVCIGSTYQAVAPGADGALMLVRTGVAVEVGDAATCRQRYEGRVLGLEAGPLLDGLHYLSGGAVGFARGLNDTPKIVALLLGADVAYRIDPIIGLALVAVVMAVGGVLNARKVAETMSKEITSINPGQGLTGNLVTALLVASASMLGLPVSTTHVSVGALFGIGIVNRDARVRTILGILVAWVTTLPLGALLGAATYWLLTRMNFAV